METFAVTVFPVAKPDEWRAWVDSIASGDRAEALCPCRDDVSPRG